MQGRGLAPLALFLELQLACSGWKGFLMFRKAGLSARQRRGAGLQADPDVGVPWPNILHVGTPSSVQPIGNDSWPGQGGGSTNRIRNGLLNRSTKNS